MVTHAITMLAAAPPNPELSIGPSDGLLAISWPADPSGWWLESTPSLAKPNWKPVAVSPVLTNDLCLVRIAPVGTSQWFRLATGQPPVALSRSPSGKLMVTWPSLAEGYSVERSDDLSGGTWTPYPATIVVTNGLRCVEFDATGSRGFFRLVKPSP